MIEVSQVSGSASPVDPGITFDQYGAHLHAPRSRARTGRLDVGIHQLYVLK